jgi:hypothetical protein
VAVYQVTQETTTKNEFVMRKIPFPVMGRRAEEEHIVEIILIAITASEGEKNKLKFPQKALYSHSVSKDYVSQKAIALVSSVHSEGS